MSHKSPRYQNQYWLLVNGGQVKSWLPNAYIICLSAGMADGGTLFLDELANTSGLIQEKLLRVIEYGEFERVGGSRTMQADVRLICAANEDLPSLAEAGEFRADLLDRLAFDVITLPPLRCRPEDIMTLAEYFAVGMARQLKLELFSGFSQTWSSVVFTVIMVRIGPLSILFSTPSPHRTDRQPEFVLESDKSHHYLMCP